MLAKPRPDSSNTASRTPSTRAGSTPGGAPSGNILDGLYLTKDFGQNWTKIQLPTAAPARVPVEQREPGDQVDTARRPGRLRRQPRDRPDQPEHRLHRRQPATASARRASSGSTPPRSTTPTRFVGLRQQPARRRPAPAELAGRRRAGQQHPAIFPQLLEPPPPLEHRPRSTRTSTTFNLIRDPNNPFNVNSTIVVQQHQRRPGVHQHRGQRQVDPVRPGA